MSTLLGAFHARQPKKRQAHGTAPGTPRISVLASAHPQHRLLCHSRSVPKNLTRTAHVTLPVDALADIDKRVGKRSRSAFLTELAQREIKIRRQREAAGAWKSEDHPELAQGAAAWVRQIRALDNQRFEELERRRDGNGFWFTGGAKSEHRKGPIQISEIMLGWTEEFR